MELTLLQRAEGAERTTAADEFRIISEAALAIFGWQDERYKRVLRLLEAGASLDAAMTLVPEGATWSKQHGFFEVEAPIPGEDGWVTSDPANKCATDALGLCAAALRARANSSLDGR